MASKSPASFELVWDHGSSSSPIPATGTRRAGSRGNEPGSMLTSSSRSTWTSSSTFFPDARPDPRPHRPFSTAELISDGTRTFAWSTDPPGPEPVASSVDRSGRQLLPQQVPRCTQPDSRVPPRRPRTTMKPHAPRSIHLVMTSLLVRTISPDAVGPRQTGLWERGSRRYRPAGTFQVQPCSALAAPGLLPFEVG